MNDLDAKFSRVLAFLATSFSSVAFAADSDMVAAGKRLFVKDAVPACALCHTLKDAGASGPIGPSLDELKPDEPRVMKAIRNGIGQMPAYSTLTDQEVQAIARYVAQVSGAAK